MYEYSVRKEIQEEVSSSAHTELLQPTVYLVDSQDSQHEYPVRKEVQEVYSLADPLLLQPILYLMDS
jgi:hypothetical protein